MAPLTSGRRNNLNNSQFAFVDSDGEGHLPIQDAAHVRNALARFGQTKFPSDSAKSAAKSKIRAAAKKFGVQVSDDFGEWRVFGEPILVTLPPVERLSLREGVALPFLRVGEHTFADYGEIRVTSEDLDRLVSNFHANARRQDLPLLNEEHIPATYDAAGDVLMGPGAIGWIKDLYRDGDTVYMVPEYNAAGEQLLAQDRYRGASPELFTNWTDPETLEEWGLTASGGALTTKPRMKGLATKSGPLDPSLAVAASERPRVLACAEQVRFAYPSQTHIDKASPDISVAYAYPAQKRLPLHSAEAVKGSKARFLTVDASESEREAAWKLLAEAAKQHGVPVPPTWKELKASECASVLMQELLAQGDDDDTDDDIASGMLPPCTYQPPYSDISRCPGFTRSDPDNDGDSDCCAMAACGCNGYVPVVSRATLVSPQSGLYREPRPGGQMADDKNDDKNKPAEPQPPVPNPSPAGPAPAPTPAPGPVPAPNNPSPAADPTNPNPAQPDQPVRGAEGSDQGRADHAEVERILAAERARNGQLEERIRLAEANAQAALHAQQVMAQNLRLAEVNDRLDAAVRSGRMFPAEREAFGANVAKLAEQDGDWALKAIENRPENSSVDFRERGSGLEGLNVSDSAKRDISAKALMSERKKAGEPITYRQALLEVSGDGFRG